MEGFYRFRDMLEEEMGFGFSIEIIMLYKCFSIVGVLVRLYVMFAEVGSYLDVF